MAAYGVFNALSAMATSFEMLTIGRFLDGLPHGAYFGVASLVAASLAQPGRKGRAVALVMLGLSVANVVGVPAATWLGQELGWRSAFWSVTGLSVLTVLMIIAFVPTLPGDREATGRREMAAFAKPQVWLTLLAGAIGFGGMFAVFSYIAPTVTEVGGLGEGAVPVFLLVFGLGMVAGTWAAGELADWSVFRSLLIGAGGMGVALLGFWLLAPHGFALLPIAFLITFLGLGAGGEPPAAADGRRRRRADPRRSPEPRLAQRRERPGRLAGRPGDRRRAGLPRAGSGRRRALGRRSSRHRRLGGSPTPHPGALGFSDANDWGGCRDPGALGHRAAGLPDVRGGHHGHDDPDPHHPRAADRGPR